MPETSVLDMTYDDVAARLLEIGCPRYRADQLWRAVYADLVQSYDEITTLPLDLRLQLADAVPLHVPEIVREAQSPDGATRKTVLRLADGETVEVVAMELSLIHI